MKRCLANCMSITLIPGVCTGLVQVLDVSASKGILRNVLDKLMTTMNQAELDALVDATDLVIGRRRALMAQAVAEA